MDLQMAQYTQCVPQDRQTVAAAVHVTKIAVTDAPALSMALVSATSVPLVAWVGQLHGT
jgi:membrane protein required for beta-lactamase induction